MFRQAVVLFGLILMAVAHTSAFAQGEDVWPAEKANDWYEKRPWPIGCNFIPSNAINQLEMWQADTFDPDTISKELALARSLGFNTVRVYLHDLLWQQDAAGFLDRIDAFLEIADAQGVKTLFVLFDGVWDPRPALGKQRPPKPGVHNSGWVQSPHKDLLANRARHGELEAYVKGVIGRFRDDARVIMWDLYNEPDNPNVLSYPGVEIENKYEMAFALLRDVFAWARSANPTQPLTTAVWQGNWSSSEKLTELDAFILENSDIISFHNYGSLRITKTRVEWLQRYNRPMVCTEYLARAARNTFEDILPFYKEHRIGAINWGLVAGKTQTIYPWGSWARPFTEEPDPWHHDIFRTDGAPYRASEVELIRSLAPQN